MHSSDRTKDIAAFDREISAHLSASFQTQGQQRANFSGFVFFSTFVWMDDACCVSCDRAVFHERVSFSDARGRYSFRGATFKAPASFDDICWATLDFADCVFEAEARMTHFKSSVTFENARFEKRAIFSESRFITGASFRRCVFSDEVSFTATEFGPDTHRQPAATTAVSPAIADFTDATFQKPESVRWLRVNRRTLSQGFHARFKNCRVEGMTFVDLNWATRGGRLIIQDELDLVAPASTSANYSSYDEPTEEELYYRKTDPELVAVVYRQLATSFENSRNHDLAEACIWGMWEMKRRDPSLGFWNVFAISVYRLASVYGTSFSRALVVFLALVLLVFPCLYSVPFASVAPVQVGSGINWKAPDAHAHSVFESLLSKLDGISPRG